MLLPCLFVSFVVQVRSKKCSETICRRQMPCVLGHASQESFLSDVVYWFGVDVVVDVVLGR